MATFVSVLSSFLVGVVLVVAPWTTLWETNYLVALHPSVRDFMLSAFTRGAVTGLGFVNLVLAVHELRGHPQSENDAR